MSNLNVLKIMRYVIVLLITSIFALSPPLQTSMKNCRILINEWNAGTSDPEEQFVELKAYCFQQPKYLSRIDMSRYRLVVISPRREVMVSCHVNMRKSFRSRTEFYFTYGGSAIEKADMNFSDCQIDSFLRTERSVYLPTGLSYPFGVMLVYNQRPDNLNITDLNNADGEYSSKVLTEPEFSKLILWVQDFYIYGSSTPFATCDIFQRILSRYTEVTSKIVRDWQYRNAEEDFSINRCTALENVQAFQPGRLAYSNPTPGNPNDCSCGFQFFIENVLQPLTEPRKVRIQTPNGFTFCYVVSEDARTSITTDEMFEMELEEAAMENSVDLMDVDIDCTQEPTCPAVQRVPAGNFDIDLSAIPNSGNKYIWDTCDYFPVSWKSVLQNDPDQPLDINVLSHSDVCYWYEYLTDKKVGRCKFCNALLEHGIVYKSRLDKIMREGYMYRNTKNKKNINTGKIIRHIETDLHKISLQYFRNLDMGLWGENLTDAMMERDGPFYQFYSPTENLLLAVYQAVRMGLSFRSFKIFTETLKHFRVNVGHVHNGNAGMKVILMHIEKMMRNDLSNYLRLHRPEVSITLDSSTDIAGKPSLAVLFQTFVEKNRPKTFFYRLLPLKGESGVELFNTFKAALEADGLDQYLREKLAGYVSDGCSVMTSTFLAELKKYVVSGVINSWCLNHRTELVSKTALRNRPLVKQIESKINALATFFGPISPKKRKVLEEKAISKGYKPFTIHRIHDIRWSESKYRAMNVVFSRWEVIVEALKKISVTNTFNVKTRSSARDLLQYYTDGTFLSTLAFLLDVTSYASIVSETLQTRGSSLIGKRRLMEGLRGRVEVLNTQYGPALSSLLQNSALRVKNVRRTPTLSEFETLAITYSGQAVSPSGLYNSSYYLHENRDEYVAAYTDRMDHYFPKTLATNFDIFNAFEMEANVESLTFGNDELTAMNVEYRWQFDMNQLLPAWRTLRTNVVLHNDFPQYATSCPEEFWAYFLNMDDDTLGWTELTRTLIRRIISVSASSSEAERVFSMASAQKTKRRYNLNVETVNALVAIRLNGVSDLRKLDSFRYAREFSREHARADDITRREAASADSDEDFFLAPFDPDYEFA